MTNRTEDRERVDPLTADRGEDAAQIDDQRARRAANLFDLRRLIGGLFIVYGVILTILGITASDAEIKKAAGINLNLYVGISLLVVGGLFLLWAFTRPLSDQLEDDDFDEYEDEEDDRTFRGTRAEDFAGSATTSRGTWRDRVGTGGDGRPGT